MARMKEVCVRVHVYAFNTFRFDHDIASASKRETLVLDQYFRFCVPSVGVSAPS